MALSQNPQIVTNGLVFYYDMYNRNKSWRGEPTTNHFAIPTPDSNGNVSFAVNGTGTFKRIFSGSFGGYDIQPSDIVYRYDLGLNGCHYHGNDVTITAGLYPTFTFDYYLSPDVTSFSDTYMANFENLGSGISAGAALPNLQKGVWQTIQINGGAASATSGLRMLLYPGGCGGSRLAATGYLLMKNPQVTFSSTSGKVLPFVAGTRSNTQAIYDLTGNNTITATNLTYASDGTFSFNGSNSSLTVPFNSSLFTFNSEQTIIIWMKNQSPSTARRNPYNQAYAGAGTITHEYDTGFNYFYGTGGGDNSPYTNLYTSFNVVVGETAMVCFTRNTTTVSCYKNGVFSNSMVNPYGSVVTGTNNITIGSGYAGAFGGSLYAVQLYNRALTASEVAQNFAAQRGIYGV
jgi:hypothetical protein